VTAAAWSTPLTPQPPARAYGHAVGFVLLAVVLFPVVYVLGPTTLVECSPDNAFDRFATWVGRGSHVDGTPGAPSCFAPHPATWIAIGLTTATCLGLAVWSLRRH
jgi:hypothetical protein